jgi:FKBP-type peptidyl-prolyl cis-trans isomerase FkpA
MLAGAAQAQALKTDDDKALYALGYTLGQRLKGDFSPTKAELELIKKGLSDGMTGAKAKVEVETYGPKINQLAQARAQKAAADQAKAAPAQKEKDAPYLEKAAKEKGAVKDPTGLVYVPLKEGTGAQPKATDTVKVHYTGTLTNGTEFDSSLKRGQPAEFPLNRVIKCWTEGLQKMKPGGKAKLVCPSDIAYGDAGKPPQIPGGATLVFEVELLEVKGGAASSK